MESFVNPIGSIPVRAFLSFDFPAGLRTPGCQPNTDPEGIEPMHEEVYGSQGMPAAEQGFPCLYERPQPFVEAEDPGWLLWPRHDQIVDQDHAVCVDHTARLSGSFVKYLIQENHKSIVKIYAVPLTFSGNPIELDEQTRPITANAVAANQWFFFNDKYN